MIDELRLIHMAESHLWAFLAPQQGSDAERNTNTAWQKIWRWYSWGLECFRRMPSPDTLMKITSGNMIDVCGDLV